MALSGVDLPSNVQVIPPPSDFVVPSIDPQLLFSQMNEFIKNFSDKISCLLLFFILLL